MLIATHYLLLKNWDIFATRCCILLIFNHNYFRGGKVIHKYYQIEIVQADGVCTIFLWAIRIYTAT